MKNGQKPKGNLEETMRSNIETIKFTGTFSALLAVITYIVALNMEIGFFQPNWSWMSNNFALAVCSGAFASFLVVLLCELQKYRSNKLTCENYMFFQAMYLYIALFSMRSTIRKLQQDNNSIIPQDCLDNSSHMALSEISALQSTDYILFKPKNQLVKAHQKFCMERALALRSAIESYNIYLKIAVNIVQRENIEKQGYPGNATASNPTVAKTLCRIDTEVSKVLDEISKYLAVIEQSTKGRYSWTAAKEKIEQGLELRLNTFEEFIGEEKPQR